MTGNDGIRPMQSGDAPALADIYRPIVEETAITFEITPPDGAVFDQRWQAHYPSHPWLVMERSGAVIGYAYAAPFKARAAYDRTVEVSVYLADSSRGAGAGKRLLLALLDVLRDRGFTEAIAIITVPNKASVGLFESLGFCHKGGLTQVGYKFDRWHDIAFFQKSL